MATRSLDIGESERDSSEFERELAMATRSLDIGESGRDSSESERELERELATASKWPESGEPERDSSESERELERELKATNCRISRLPDEGPDFWNSRCIQHRYMYDSSSYDWYLNYRILARLFDRYLSRHHRILNVGCGDSALSEDMVNDGYQDVVNIDRSSELIETMQAKYADKPALKYIKMDPRDMSPFESGSFDAVLDKGAFDTFMGVPYRRKAPLVLLEVHRVLKDKGAYIMITFDDPEHRLPFLRQFRLWNIKLHLLARVEKSPGETFWHLSDPDSINELTEVLGTQYYLFFVYVCIKDESLRANQATDIEISSSENDS